MHKQVKKTCFLLALPFDISCWGWGVSTDKLLNIIIFTIVFQFNLGRSTGEGCEKMYDPSGSMIENNWETLPYSHINIKKNKTFWLISGILMIQSTISHCKMLCRSKTVCGTLCNISCCRTVQVICRLLFSGQVQYNSLWTLLIFLETVVCTDAKWTFNSIIVQWYYQLRQSCRSSLKVTISVLLTDWMLKKQPWAWNH